MGRHKVGDVITGGRAFTYKKLAAASSSVLSHFLSRFSHRNLSPEYLSPSHLSLASSPGLEKRRILLFLQTRNEENLRGFMNSPSNRASNLNYSTVVVLETRWKARYRDLPWKKAESRLFEDDKFLLSLSLSRRSTVKLFFFFLLLLLFLLLLEKESSEGYASSTLSILITKLWIFIYYGKKASVEYEIKNMRLNNKL